MPHRAASCSAHATSSELDALSPSQTAGFVRSHCQEDQINYQRMSAPASADLEHRLRLAVVRSLAILQLRVEGVGVGRGWGVLHMSELEHVVFCWPSRRRGNVFFMKPSLEFASRLVRAASASCGQWPLLGRKWPLVCKCQALRWTEGGHGMAGWTARASTLINDSFLSSTRLHSPRLAVRVKSVCGLRCAAPS